MSEDWQKALLDRHRSWIANDHLLMAVGDGWEDVLARLFERIGSELSRRPGRALHIDDVKEKYATLRFDWTAAVDEETERSIESHVLLAEMRSACTCDVCGAEGKMRSTRAGGGWVAVRCYDHAVGFPHVESEGPPRWKVDDGGRRRWGEYDRERDAWVELVLGEDEL